MAPWTYRPRIVIEVRARSCGGRAREENSMLTRYVASILAVVATVLTAAPARAQIQTGSLVVKAVDEQGALMPGATVTVTSPALPREMVGVTDTSGVYQLPGLPVGTYTIKTSLEGFKTVIREGVLVHQGQSTTLEITVSVGALSEALTVKGESPVVDTRSSG